MDNNQILNVYGVIALLIVFFQVSGTIKKKDVGTAWTGYGLGAAVLGLYLSLNNIR